MAVSRRKQKPEEDRPPVTQVVEVVEEQEEPDTISAEAVSPPISESMEESVEEVKEEGEEKRRVLVDELFQKKESIDSELAPEISMHKRSPSRSIMTWAIVSIVACIVVGGGLLLFSGKEKIPSLFTSPTPTSTSTPIPSPIPAELKKDAITVEVLNGSGVAGVAGKMKTLLEEKGYTVSDTGNADNYKYKNTEIIVKAGKEGYIKLLEEDLQGAYTIGTSAATLEEDAKADVHVIVGGE